MYASRMRCILYNKRTLVNDTQFAKFFFAKFFLPVTHEVLNRLLRIDHVKSLRGNQSFSITTSVKIISKILEIEIEIAEKSKETRVKYSLASIPTCELL